MINIAGLSKHKPQKPRRNKKHEQEPSPKPVRHWLLKKQLRDRSYYSSGPPPSGRRMEWPKSKSILVRRQRQLADIITPAAIAEETQVDHALEDDV